MQKLAKICRASWLVTQKLDGNSGETSIFFEGNELGARTNLAAY
jgi:hypothetical protein